MGSPQIPFLVLICDRFFPPQLWSGLHGLNPSLCCDCFGGIAQSLFLGLNSAITPGMVGELYWTLGMELGSAKYKASTLLSVLSLVPKVPLGL